MIYFHYSFACNEIDYQQLSASITIFQSYYSTLDNLTLLMFNLLPIVLLLTLNMKLIFTLKRVAKEDSKRGGLTLSVRFLSLYLFISEAD